MKKYITPKINYRHVEYKLLCGSAKQEGGIIGEAPDMPGEMNCECGGDPDKCTCGEDCDCWGCKW